MKTEHTAQDQRRHLTPSGKQVSPDSKPLNGGGSVPAVAEDGLRRDLQRQVAGLRFPAFAALAQEVLRRSGYHKVVFAGLSPRGRILHGGCDLTAYTYTDLETVVTAIQLKQYQRLVSRRFVDELRGAMLRLHAEQGLLITTSRFSSAVRTLARTSEIAPVRLMDGAELISILLHHRIGLCEHEGKWQVDREFFKRLGKAEQATLPAAIGICGESLIANTDNSQFHNPVPAPARRTHIGGDMTWSTHAMIGINTLWLQQVLPQGFAPSMMGILAAVAALGALLPDLDASESKIKYLQVSGIRPFYVPATILHRQLGHRGLLHSLPGLGMIGLALLPLAAWWGWPVSLALILGYASHLAADACTRSGIPLLFPRKRRFHLLPRPLRIVTGSKAEDMVFAVCAALALLLLLRQLAAVYAPL